MTSAIFFDMDGTLFNTTTVLPYALHATFDELRQAGMWHEETPLQQYMEIMGVPLPVVWETLCPNFTHDMREQANRLFHDYLIAAIRSGKGQLYDGVHELLQQLPKPLFITSNGEVAYLQAIVETFQLTSYFKQVYSITEINSLKKAELVKLAMQQHDVSTGCIIGDRLSDIQAGQENGLYTIGVNFDFAQQIELQQADAVIDSLQEAIRLIETVNKTL